MEIPNQYIKNLYKALLAFLIIISLFFVVRLLTEFRSYGMMGSNGANTITLSGHGEMNAVPDIANIDFSISKTAKTVKEAQDGVAVIEAKALDFLKTKNVADKDIKTSNASFYPKYDYVRIACPQDATTGSMMAYDCGNKQVLTGYEASESIAVKVRKTDDAGAIMQGLGTTGVSNLSGPNFAIDKEDSLKAKARKEAIDDARTKAEVLAKDLGVRLGRISNFSESGGGYPIMYANSAIMKDVSVATSAPAVIPKGENTISSDVTITYEIR
ncbi:MAG: SIMPL domain-containing protein [bacterium]